MQSNQIERIKTELKAEKKLPAGGIEPGYQRVTWQIETWTLTIMLIASHTLNTNLKYLYTSLQAFSFGTLTAHQAPSCLMPFTSTLTELEHGSS